MNKADAIERLCRLTTKVGTEVYRDVYPHDCFCMNGPNPVISEMVVAYIERAVQSAMKRGDA